MATLRAVLILAILGLVTPFGVALQAVLLRLRPEAAARLPVLYHRFVCRLLGVRVRAHNRTVPDRPLLLVSNHVSWLDIPVLSTLAPLSFIAKQEVGKWPIIGTLARLQRTVFVDRQRRAHMRRTNRELAARLAAGDVMVLFAEGTSSDGNRVLPFRSALLGAVADVARQTDTDGEVMIQPVALAYVRLNGLPMGRQHRPVVAWFGDTEFAPHAWRLLTAGTIDVEVVFGEPIRLSANGDRKAVAAIVEAEVRRVAMARLAGRDC